MTALSIRGPAVPRESLTFSVVFDNDRKHDFALPNASYREGLRAEPTPKGQRAILVTVDGEH
jgi:hypothetical protein